MRDFNEFVRHHFNERKAKNPAYSLKVYARDIGVNSALLSRLFRGTVDPEMELKVKIIQKLNLTSAETEAAMNQFCKEGQ